MVGCQLCINTDLGAFSILPSLILATALQPAVTISVSHMRNAWLGKVKSLAQGDLAGER